MKIRDRLVESPGFDATPDSTDGWCRRYVRTAGRGWGNGTNGVSLTRESCNMPHRRLSPDTGSASHHDRTGNVRAIVVPPHGSTAPTAEDAPCARWPAGTDG